MYKLREIVSLVIKQAICLILLINNYEMVKVTVGLKQLVVSVFLFLGFISHWVSLLLTLLVN